ncbi:hypothetical protein AK830_g4051 [Neonectria ditissima]|uniref:Uncharacterized protein n=1 Tax=Neonectria ditissima TaxID=78410 RepID=A0A0N8H7R1_9HYPO|nr:hypothetical protein AK830_g4051 [Neonectria ditissima]
MAQQFPLFTTVYGINLLAMSKQVLPPPPPNQPQVVPLEENSWEFTTKQLSGANLACKLAAALNIGLDILESASGRAALAALGNLVVQEWHRTPEFRFAGDVSYMNAYVDHFLFALRKEFPNVVIENLGGPEVLAATRRLPKGQWNGDLWAYRPKSSVGLYFNSGRVEDMKRAAADSKMALRYKHFMFMFGCATSHELCHSFVAYLSQNSADDFGYTPPNVSHLNYGETLRAQGSLRTRSGESGRWFENKLFGGSLEFYEDPRLDSGQVGVAYVLDEEDVAWKIKADAIVSLVQNAKEPQVPFERVYAGITGDDRRRRGLRSLGSTSANSRRQVSQSYMRAAMAPVSHRFMHNVPRSKLVLFALDPRAVRAVAAR